MAAGRTQTERTRRYRAKVHEQARRVPALEARIAELEAEVARGGATPAPNDGQLERAMELLGRYRDMIERRAENECEEWNDIDSLKLDIWEMEERIEELEFYEAGGTEEEWGATQGGRPRVWLGPNTTARNPDEPLDAWQARKAAERKASEEADRKECEAARKANKLVERKATKPAASPRRRGSRR